VPITTGVVSYNLDQGEVYYIMTTDDVESNDGDGFEMYILESADYCK
jgi:hypothetical protein